uniref:Uncharacterized protein n=1 Tax=Plectus sambesii TaxID=2011161 RepID=A0A914W5I6_9BILA
MQDNVLLEAQRDEGFTSTGTARLGFSYWLMVGACVVLLMPIAFLALSGIKCRRRSAEVEKEIYPTTEKGLFMY